MPQMMNLLLPRDVALGSTRVLDVLLPAHHLPQRRGIGPFGVPHLYRKDHRVLARLVVEYGLDRRVRINATVPIRVAVDVDGRERWRQCTGGEHMVDAHGFVATVEVAHFARPDVYRADRQANLASIEMIEVDQVGEGVLERC